MVNKIVLGCYFLLATSFFVFFSIFYKYHLFFVEQLSVFLFDYDYFVNQVNDLGGVCIYLGNFLIQFFCIDYLAGVILLFLIFAISLLLQMLGRTYNCWALLPILFFSFLIIKVEMNLGLIVSILLSLFFSYIYKKYILRKAEYICFLFVLSFIPILFFCLGLSAFIFLFFVLFIGRKKKYAVLMSFCCLVETMLVVGCICTFFKVDFFDWLNCSKFQVYNLFYLAFIYIYILFYLIIQNSNIFLKRKVHWIINVAFPLFIFLGVGIVFGGKINFLDEKLYKCEYLMRKQKWDDLLSIHSDQEVITSYINIGLLSRGNISERLFCYPQNENVNEFWSSEYLPLSLMGELYYRLNMFGAARAYFFMAQTQSLRGYTPFTLMRLAELEYKRGNFKSSFKFLSVLKKTFFYKKWAKSFEEDFLLNEEIKDRYVKECSDLFVGKNLLENLCIMLNTGYNISSNKNIIEMALVKCMLKNNHSLFFDILNKHSVSLGKVYQEYILMYAYMKNDVCLIDKWDINKSIIKDFYEYVSINQSNVSKSEKYSLLEKKYKDTYWFYSQFK